MPLSASRMKRIMRLRGLVDERKARSKAAIFCSWGFDLISIAFPDEKSAG